MCLVHSYKIHHLLKEAGKKCWLDFNEGNLVIFCNPTVLDELIIELQKDKYGKQAKVIGKVTKNQQVVGIDDQGHATIIEYLYGQELTGLC